MPLQFVPARHRLLIVLAERQVSISSQMASLGLHSTHCAAYLASGTGSACNAASLRLTSLGGRLFVPVGGEDAGWEWWRHALWARVRACVPPLEIDNTRLQEAAQMHAFRYAQRSDARTAEQLNGSVTNTTHSIPRRMATDFLYWLQSALYGDLALALLWVLLLWVLSNMISKSRRLAPTADSAHHSDL